MMNVHASAPAPLAGKVPPPPAPSFACTAAMWSPARDVLVLSTMCPSGPGGAVRPFADTQLQLPRLRTPALRIAVGAWLDAVGGRSSGPRPSIVAALEGTRDLADLFALRRYFRVADATTGAPRDASGWSRAFGLVGEALDRRIDELQAG